MLINEILESAGVTTKPSSSSDNEVTLCCPFCTERGFPVDTSYHLGINIKTALGHCFRCDWKGRGVVYIARQLSRIYKVPFQIRHARQEDVVDAVESKKEKHEVVLAGLPAEYESLTSNVDFVGRKVRDYLKSRGVSLLQIVRHRIGFAGAGSMSWRAIFPVIDSDNNIHGCVGRAVVEDVKPKYLNTPGMKILWNAGKARGVAVVVEGIMDALRVETALLQVRNMRAVARLGSAVTSAELDQLKEFDSIIVLPDWDRTGVRGATELCERATTRGIRVSVSVPEVMDGRDPGDMEEDQLVELIGDAVPWNKAAEQRMRMSKTRVGDVVSIG